jgi:archaellum biogenesis ATPase FlaH
METLSIEIKKINSDLLQQTVIDNLKESYQLRNATDFEYIKEHALTFCKNQTLKTAIMDSVDLLERQDYDGIKVRIDEAMKAGTSKDLGHDYIKGLEERMTKTTRKTVSTGWDIIDEVMDGGLGAGELGVLVAPAGIGKTWCLQKIVQNAIKVGKKVVHYTLELNQEYVGLRYDTIFSGVPTGDLKFRKEEVEKSLQQVKGQLLIKYFPTRSATVQTLNAHLKQCEISGFKPNLVIVDYADIMRDVGHSKELRLQLGNIYEDLRGLAGEMEIPIWTASQANRSSLEEDVIGAEKVAESYTKVMTADFVLSISRKIEDKAANTARCHIIKNRFGVDGITYPVSMNTTIGLIDIHRPTSKMGSEATKKMKSSEDFLRQTAANIYAAYKTDEKEKPSDKKIEGFE